MIRVGVITTSRADYGILHPLLRGLQNDARFQVQLYVCGAHLAAAHGMTVQEIEADAIPIHDRIETISDDDSPEGLAKSIGLGCIGFGQAFARTRPDWLVLLGDRFELFAGGLASLPFNIPILHLHGGELTEGAMDDALRHALTKFSHLHGVATQTYWERVVQLGEEPWRVHVVGALSLDNLNSFTPMPRAELESRFDLDLSIPPLLVTFHPVTREYGFVGEQTDQLLAALAEQTVPIIFTLPNADTYGSIVRNRLQQFCAARPSARLVANFGQDAYFSMMSLAAAMVGNSSSGLIEAPSFRLPVVNIRSRQQGRLRAANVIDVAPIRKDILHGLRKALSNAFRNELANLQNPYGDGHACGRILDLLSKTPINDRLLKKQFYTVSRAPVT